MHKGVQLVKKSKRIRRLSIVFLIASVLVAFFFYKKMEKNSEQADELVKTDIIEKTFETKSNEATIIIEDSSK